MGMTREEAIKVLDDRLMSDDVIYVHHLSYAEALGMAIEALKAQVPRVMTLEEVQAHKIGEPLFYESRIIYPCWVIRLKDEKGRIHFFGYVGNIFKDKSEYGIRWRCWTSRPTDAQREAILWN